MRGLTYRTILFVLFALGAAAGVRANTYDKHTLVAITTASPEEVQVLYSCGIDILGRQGDVYRALLTPDQLGDLTAKGLQVDILYDEMERERTLLASPGWCANTASPCYWYPAKFNTTNPASGTIMRHLLDLYNAHPTLCRLYNLGATQDGSYDIIAMKVTKNPDALEAEPKIRIYGNIHGDEVCGLMVACDVLDWILANYPSNATAQKLVDESEMWFIPMGNPYGNANQTRYNVSNVDLNRNFWGPGGSDESPAWSEKETQAIRDLTETATADHPKKRFATSLSFHGGETCFNSVYNYQSAATSDEPIFFSARSGGPTGGGRCSSLCASPAASGLAKAYQDGCTQSTFWYTNGADWYTTRGDTNDWSYGMWGDLDTTVEVNVNKWPDSSTIPTYVAQHRQGVLNYMMKTFQGIHGVMTDQATGAALDGTVEATCTASTAIAVPHPYQAVFTDPVAGDFHRVLQPGTYTVTCKATGYADRVVTGVVVTADTKTTCNCPMTGTTSLHTAAYSFTDSCSGTGTGGGDGVLDPGEDATVPVTLSNSGVTQATHVTGTLSTSQTGVTLVDGSASFADVPGGGTGASVAPHFAVRVDPSVACGTVIPFTLHLTSDQGSWDDTLSRTVGTVAVGGGTLLTESFDGATFPPTGWAQVDVANTAGNWARSTATVHPSGSTPHSGAGLAYFNSYTSSSGCTTRLYRTSATAIPGSATGATLNFYMFHDANSGYTDQVQAQVSTNGTTWTNVGTPVSRYDGSTGWKKASVSLNAYVGQSVYVALLGISNYGYDCHVDDVTLEYTAPGACTSHACTPALLPPDETAPGTTLSVAEVWSADKTTHSWPANAQATGYKVVRGVAADLPNLLTSAADSCLKWSGTSTSCTLSENPGGGTFYWYLVVGTNGGGDGAAGTATAGTRTVNTSGGC